MVVPCSTNALYAITNFANALERYQRSAEDFFSPALLKILSDTFQWKNLGLTCYSGDQFLGCYGINRAKFFNDIYPVGFQRRDAFAKYITRCAGSLSSRRTPVICSSELARQERGDFGENLDFWGRAGLHYVATLAFPTHRISFYKSIEEGDFGEAELAHLACIYSMLSEHLVSFQKQQALQICSVAKDAALQQVDLKFIVFDERGNPLEYSKQVLPLLQRLYGTGHLPLIFQHLLSLFPQESESAISLPKMVQRYTIRMNTLSWVDSFQMIKRYFCFSISSPTPCAEFPQETFNRFNTLSRREWEVLSAFCSGKDYHEVAKALFISDSTVRTHLKNIYRKLEVDNQRTLLRMFNQYEQALKIQG